MRARAQKLSWRQGRKAGAVKTWGGHSICTEIHPGRGMNLPVKGQIGVG